ncbi:hypothetical protein GCM10022396_36320 [Flavivirga amylovorans]
MVDDLNTMVGAFDGSAITPNIDALAKESLQFNEAYAVSPSCNPSRAAMMTGLRPEVTKVYNNGIPFRSTPESKNLITLPQLLKGNGYNSIMAGKIFHGRRRTEPKPRPESDPISWTFQAGIETGNYTGKNFKKEFLDENKVPLWIRRGFGVPDEQAKKSIKSTWNYGPTDVDPSNTLDFNTAEFGSAFLNKDLSHPEVAKAPRVDEKPFFLALGIFRPHIPMIAPKQFFDMYETPENKHRIELPNYPADDLDDLPKSAPSGLKWFLKYVKPYPEEHKRLRHAYLASTTYADAAVGIILDGLKKSGLEDNTIIVFMGDHGYQLGMKERLGKAVLWRGSSRTPMLIKVPGKPIGKVNEPVSMIDIYPTLVEMTSVKAPHKLAGESLVPFINNPKAKRDIPAIVTSTSPRQHVSIVQDQWNYINYVNGDEELYDHTNDPQELNNLLSPQKTNAHFRKVADELKKLIPKNRT